jgi:hypothetical protein
MPVTMIAAVPHELAAWWRMPGAVGTLIGGTLLSGSLVADVRGPPDGSPLPHAPHRRAGRDTKDSRRW